MTDTVIQTDNYDRNCTFSVHSYPDDTQPYTGCHGQSLSDQTHTVLRLGCLLNNTSSTYDYTQLNDTTFNKQQVANDVEGSSYSLTSYHISICLQRVMQPLKNLTLHSIFRTKN
jgi:hypothetical protein